MKIHNITTINGVLLICGYGHVNNAPCISESINAFTKHSKFQVVVQNAAAPFNVRLNRYRFTSIVIHYSAIYYGFLPESSLYQYVMNHENAHVSVFFQDEYTLCQQRFNMLNDLRAHTLYTVLELSEAQKLYSRDRVPTLHTIKTCLTGYVSEEMIDYSRRFSLSPDKRDLDIFYRVRQCAYWLGGDSQLKYRIGELFLANADKLGLTVDIDWRETTRIYGDEWYRRLGRSHGTLGAESAITLHDADGFVAAAHDRLLQFNPDMTFDEMYDKLLKFFDGNITCHVLAPRHLESAVMHTCPIMYGGSYSGILVSGKHYLELARDNSNLFDVVDEFKNPKRRKEIVDRAYDDLITSGLYTYEIFIKTFDAGLIDAGLTPGSRELAPGFDSSIEDELHSSEAADSEKNAGCDRMDLNCGGLREKQLRNLYSALFSSALYFTQRIIGALDKPAADTVRPLERFLTKLASHEEFCDSFARALSRPLSDNPHVSREHAERIAEKAISALARSATTKRAAARCGRILLDAMLDKYTKPGNQEMIAKSITTRIENAFKKRGLVGRVKLKLLKASRLDANIRSFVASAPDMIMGNADETKDRISDDDQPKDRMNAFVGSVIDKIWSSEMFDKLREGADARISDIYSDSCDEYLLKKGVDIASDKAAAEIERLCSVFSMRSDIFAKIINLSLPAIRENSAARGE